MFIVHADTGKPNEAKFTAQKATPKDAMLTAIDLIGQGMTNVMIIDEKGSVFKPADFAKLHVGSL